MIQFETLATRPIPAINALVGWKKVAVSENGEPLVALSTLINDRLLTEPEYFLKGIPGALEEIYLRESVAHKLVAAAEDLPAGYALLVWDAWRPLAVQEALFDAYFQVVSMQYPTLSRQEVHLRTESYVSLPSKSPLCPSPHYTGGAVDLTLADMHGKALCLGSEFDGFDATTGTRFFEDRLAQGQALSEAEEMALRYRRILFHTMRAHGFTNYVEEWWHFDYGNQFWGIQAGQTAFYGPIEPGFSPDRYHAFSDQ